MILGDDHEAFSLRITLYQRQFILFCSPHLTFHVVTVLFRHDCLLSSFIHVVVAIIESVVVVCARNTGHKRLRTALPSGQPSGRRHKTLTGSNQVN